MRRAVACAYALLDEVQRSLARRPDDHEAHHGLAAQAAEELARLAHLLKPPAVADLFDAE